MCCLRVCKGNFPLRIRRKTPRPPCFRRPFGAGSCSGICRAICAKRDGVFWLRAGRGCLSTYHRGGWSFLVAGGAKVSLYLPMRGMEVFLLREGQRCLSTYRRGGMEFFGCGRGKGVSLPTAEGAGSFLVAGRARVSLYLPPRCREFFGCRQGKGVYLLTAAGGWEFFGCGRGEGVLLPTAVGGWIFLVANRAKVSFYLPPRDRSRKTPTPQAGWAVVGDCGRIIGAKRILYERNVGGLNNLVLAQEEQ